MALTITVSERSGAFTARANLADLTGAGDGAASPQVVLAAKAGTSEGAVELLVKIALETWATDISGWEVREVDPWTGRVKDAVPREPSSMVEAMDWTFLYAHNVSHYDILRIVYGAKEDDERGRRAYLAEKMGILDRRGLAGLWAQLDNEHRRRLAEAVKARYGSGEDV